VRIRNAGKAATNRIKSVAASEVTEKKEIWAKSVTVALAVDVDVEVDGCWSISQFRGIVESLGIMWIGELWLFWSGWCSRDSGWKWNWDWDREYCWMLDK
jgi:hypothetical protein